MLPLQINWLKLIPYVIEFTLIIGLWFYGHHEHAGKIEAQQRYSQLQIDIVTERAKAKAEADARLSIASEQINAQAATVQAQEAELAKLGITRQQTQKDLQNALKTNAEILVSRDNVLDGLNRLQSANGKSDNREGQVTTVLPISQEECVRASETERVIKQASIFAVNDYDSCIAQLTAIYKQHGQEIHFTDEGVTP